VKNIVFILGAGASADIEFPTAHYLGINIRELIRSPGSSAHKLVMDQFPDPTLRSQLLERLYYSELATIDELLTTYQDDSVFMRFGKTIVAAILAGKEIEANLFPMRETCWYRDLLFALRKRPAAIINRNVSFITFNYERSLEHYLERALVHSNNAEKHVHRFLGRDNFIHVHGQLGLLPWQGDGGRTYSEKLDAAGLKTAADGIMLPHEDLGDVNARITAAVERAEIVCVCGFGFHAANVTRSQLKALVRRKIIFITIQGMPAEAVQATRLARLKIASQVRSQLQKTIWRDWGQAGGGDPGPRGQPRPKGSCLDS
jgi:hypothetical protein